MLKFGMLKQSVIMSVQNIISNKMRTFLTTLGIIIGVAAVIAMVTTVSAVSGSGAEEWKVGDRVSHRKFGLGVVEAVEPLNADAQVTVQFVKAGTKKLLAGLAGLKKVE